MNGAVKAVKVKYIQRHKYVELSAEIGAIELLLFLFSVPLRNRPGKTFTALILSLEINSTFKYVCFISIISIVPEPETAL